mgnify:CR=1 FL=1
MNHAGSHHGHMWLIGAIAVGALLLGYGIGSALAVAAISCAVVLGAIIWFMRRTQQSQPERVDRDDAHRR